MACLAAVAAVGAWAESDADAEVDIVDLNLRTAVERAIGVQPGYPIRASDMARLTVLDASDVAYEVLELAGLQHAVNLERLDLRGNRVVDLSPLAHLLRLRRLGLDDNDITDIAPLVANAGLGPGDRVFLAGNRLSAASIEGLAELESKGVFVAYRDDHGDSNTSATTLALGSTSSGGIDRTGDVDYFRFQVSSSADVAIFTTGADTRGDLLTGVGRLLVSDSGSGALGNFLIHERLEPGLYYVRVTGARGPYTIHAVEGAEVRFRDTALRARVADALGDVARDGVSSSELATLVGTLDAGGRFIFDLGGLEAAVNLTGLKLNRNRLRSVGPLASLVSLDHLDLEGNAVEDVAPLVANPGLGPGDRVFLGGNRLSDDAVDVAIPALERRGVFVGHADAHGDDLDTAAASLTLGGRAHASIYPAGDRDVFRLRVDTATDVAIHATGGTDTFGVLYDAEGNRLAANDRTGGRTNFMIARTLDAGDYLVEVRGADASVRGPYAIEAYEDPNAAVLPDVNLRAIIADALNKPPQARIAAVDLAALQSLHAAGYGIANLSGLELAVNLTHLDLDGNRIVDIDPVSRLTALAELRLAANAISDLGPLLANAGFADGDRVYLQGNPLSPTAANAQVPALVARGVAVLYGDDHANLRSGATALPLGGSVAGTIHGASDRDYFVLTVSGARTPVAVFTTGDVDAVGTLTGGRGVQPVTDDDGGAGENFLLRAALDPGDYYIRVDGYADAVGTYTVHAVVDEAVSIPDERLRVRLESAVSGTPIATGDLAALETLDAASAGIENLAGLDAAANLRHLNLRHNRIEDVQALSGMTALAELDLEGNGISDIGPLADNAGLGRGDKIVLAGNPLGDAALDVHLPALRERGAYVGYLDDHGNRTRTATALSPGGSAASALSASTDEDVFRLDLAAATDIAIYTTGATDTEGRLSRSGTSRLATDNSGGTAGNFAIRRRLAAGTYHVIVGGSGPGLAGVGPYTLHVGAPPPAAPANVTALRDGSSLVVTWDPLPPGTGGVTRYRVTATPSDGSAPLYCTTGPSATGCTITDLAADADYAITVQAVNAVGFGPAGTATPASATADTPRPRFWHGWRLTLAAPPSAEN